jgi:hypothetical protein
MNFLARKDKIFLIFRSFFGKIIYIPIIQHVAYLMNTL